MKQHSEKRKTKAIEKAIRLKEQELQCLKRTRGALHKGKNKAINRKDNLGRRLKQRTYGQAECAILEAQIDDLTLDSMFATKQIERANRSIARTPVTEHYERLLRESELQSGIISTRMKNIQWRNKDTSTSEYMPIRLLEAECRAGLTEIESKIRCTEQELAALRRMRDLEAEAG